MYVYIYIQTLPLITEDVSPPAVSAPQRSCLSVNRQAALPKLRKKVSFQDHWVAVPKSVTSNAEGSLLLVSSVVPSTDQKDLQSFLPPKWTVLKEPNISLRNSLNKCWFHAGLHLLSCIPTLRSLCMSSSNTNLSTFEIQLFNAVRALFHTRSCQPVALFFRSVMDFNGVNNRFGQVATSDFIEHLCSRSPKLLQELKFSFSATLQCIPCKWVSHKVWSDVSLKLYLPPDKKSISLADLVGYNSKALMDSKDAVHCGKCMINTPHSVTRDYDPDV